MLEKRASSSTGFTLLEVILAMVVMALLAGAIYGISTGGIQATQETLHEQLMIRRVEGFLHIARRAFWNLPGNAKIYLTPPPEGNDSALPDLTFENATGLFGTASLGGGTLILSARAKSNGTRTFSILRLPKNSQDFDQDALYAERNWIQLLPEVSKPVWSFYRNGNWYQEWNNAAGRPQLVRLQMEVAAIPYPIEAIFYVPPVKPNRISLLGLLKEFLQQQAEENPNPLDDENRLNKTTKKHHHQNQDQEINEDQKRPPVPSNLPH